MRVQNAKDVIRSFALALVIATLVAHSASAQSSTAVQSSTPAQPPPGTQEQPAAQKPAAAQPSTAAQSSAAAQSAHQSCIAIVTPTVEGVPGNAADAANGVRDLMATYLQGPSTKIVPLEAKLPSQATEEAKQKGCEPILVFSVARKAGSSHSLLKALGRGASVSSWSLPGGSSTGSAVAHAGAAGGLQTVSSMAESTKAKDEIHLEYRLQSADGQVQFGPQSERLVAKSDGEDLLTPAVMRAAEAIVSHKTGK